MKSNFKCPCCGKEFFVSKYTYNTVEYKLPNKKQVVCDVSECKETPLKYIDKPFSGAPSFGKFASMSLEGKSDMLKKRSSEHYQKEIKEVEHQMNKDMQNNLKQQLSK